MSPLALARASAIETSSLPPRHCRRSAHIPTARSLARRYGSATAARYLRTRGWSLEAALLILTGRWPFATRGSR